MFDPVTINAQIDRLGGIAPSMDVIVLKRGHAAATGTMFGRSTARGGVAVAAHEGVAACHERRWMKLAAVVALSQHQAASVT
jgi:hypothetical protein